jgi:hypothetical protein
MSLDTLSNEELRVKKVSLQIEILTASEAKKQELLFQITAIRTEQSRRFINRSHEKKGEK